MVVVSLIPLLGLREAALELARANMQQYRQLANTDAVAQLQIKEKEEAFKAAQARLERAKAGLNSTAVPVAIASERIAQERARGEFTLATLDKERESLQQRLFLKRRRYSHLF